MRRRALTLPAGAALLSVVLFVARPPAPARAAPGRSPIGSVVSVGSLSGLAGSLVNSAPSGNPLSAQTAGVGSLAGVALGVFAGGVLGGAGSALRETAHVIGHTTAPRLQSTWFSSTYWRVAALGALLSLPFLFAAAAQALLRADPALMARSVFGYLPLALIGVNLVAPITMLLLAATDEMCTIVAGAGMGGGVHFLQQTAQEVGGLSVLDGSPFLAIVVGLLTLGAALALALEMLVREAAVYVVVLMLPLALAALIWPARRIWAIRLMELLVALILSKFVIVAVLSLAGAAYGAAGSPTITRLLTAMTLVMLSTFAPWAMLRLLPFTELASGAAGGIRGELSRASHLPVEAASAAGAATAWTQSLPDRLRRQAAEPEGPEDASSDRVGIRADSALTSVTRAGAEPEPGPSTVGGTGSAEQVPVGAPNLDGSGSAQQVPLKPPPGATEEAPSTVTATDGRACAANHNRLPGMEARWQVEDGGWDDTALSPEGILPPQPTGGDR